MTKELHNLINRKAIYVIKYKQTGNRERYDKYASIRSLVNKKYRNASKQYFICLQSKF